MSIGAGVRPRPDPFEQLETRGIVAEYFLRAVGLRSAFTEIAVARSPGRYSAAVSVSCICAFLVRQSVRKQFELQITSPRLAFFVPV